MYYARGRVHPNVVKGEREKEEEEEEEKYENDDDEEEDEEAEGEEGKEEERARGRKRRTRRRTKGGSMCVTCVAAITKSRGWLPGNAFQPHILTPPSTNPQNPLVRSPFASWRTLSSATSRALFLFLSRTLFLTFIQRDV